MPCYHPLKGWLSKDINATGKRSIVFTEDQALVKAPVSVPCGQCIGCRLERSRQWAIRCVHEASLYDNNCFVTLTFDDSNLDSSGSLVKADFQKFMKRLRKYAAKKEVWLNSGRVRYFHCGEYGSKLQRPHHHACLFNFDFEDKVLWTIRDGVRLYRSEDLEKLWPFGFCTIGDVTFESAAYVARYVTKKIFKDYRHPELKDKFYNGRVEEYTTMSRRPGIGKGWFDKFSSDVFPHGFVIIRNGLKCRPPAYYERIFDLTNPVVFAKLKERRGFKAFNNINNSSARLAVREFLQVERAKRLERSFENESVCV